MSCSIEDTDKKRLECSRKFLKYCLKEFPQPTSLEVSPILNALDQGKCKLNSKVLDASECFIAANEIEKDFPGPALLLYVSAINTFAIGEDEDLKSKIQTAQKLITNVNKDLWENDNVQAMYNAAVNKATIQSVNKFLKTEISEALTETFYKTQKPQGLANEIVESSHKVRHEAKTDEFDNSVMVVHGGNISVLSVEEIKRGKTYLGGKIVGIHQLHLSNYRRLCRPAKMASSICIFKRIRNINF